VTTALAEGRYPVTEAEETTRDWIAYSVDCPECGEPAGFRCVYTTGPETAVSAYGRPRDYLHLAKFHLKGDMTRRPHFARSNLAAEKALRAAIRDRRAAARKAAPPKPALPVTDKEAYEIKCPLCGREPGRKCVRTQAKKKREMYGTGYTGRWVTVHRKGTNISRPHSERRAAAARLRLERWKRENPAAWLREDAEQARAALAAFDLAEYEKLRDWLAEHGPILWGGTRPDGSRRGEPLWGVP
jgi:hypothetical protein